MQAAGLSPTASPFLPTAMPNAAPPAQDRQFAFAQRDSYARGTAASKTKSAPPAISVPSRGFRSTVMGVVCCPVRTVYDIFQLVFSVPCVVCCAAC